MASLTDWLARTLFIDDEQEANAQEVKAMQQAVLDRQKSEGKWDPLSALTLQSQIDDTGTAYFNRELGKPGASGLPGLAFSYWWIFAIIGLVIFLHMGGAAFLQRKLFK